MSISIKSEQDFIKAYLEDSSNLRGGHADEVILPSTIEELSAVVHEANSSRTPVTVSGGGTGTAGGRIPFGGIVVSMERFNRILDVSGEKMSCVAESGVSVDDLSKACESKELFYTSHPTEWTAFVGGTVATNASGARSFKYGPIRRYVKRLEMVLANGEMLEIRRGEIKLTREDSMVRLPSGRAIPVPLPTYVVPSIKNSAGYFAKDGMDLIDLFIGQEGTLSIITEIELDLVKKPAKILSCFAFFKNEIDAWDFADNVRLLSRYNEAGSGSRLDALSIEYFDANALNILRMKNRNVPAGVKAAIFFEQELSRETEEETWARWLKLIENYHVSLDDTWCAMNANDTEMFTKLRHYIPEAINDIVRQSGFQKLSTDIAVPNDKFRALMEFYTETFRNNDIGHAIFGHIGESHVHINLLPRSGHELKRAQEIVLEFIKKAVALGGTVSAEHGVGKTKHRYLEIMYGRAGVLEMARIKKAFDPNCILGLDNIFSKELLKST